MQQRSFIRCAMCLLAVVGIACAPAKQREPSTDPEEDDETVEREDAQAPIKDAGPNPDTAAIIPDVAPRDTASPDMASKTPDAAPDTQMPDTKADAPPATFKFVKTIFANYGCAGCHEPAEANHVNLTETTNLYTRLFNAKPPAASDVNCRSQTLVVPNDFGKSLLYQKVIANGVLNKCGKRMPPDCEDDSCVSAEEADAIKRWIMAGAPNN